MVQQTSALINRPPPGHYRGRLTHLIDSIPVAAEQPRSSWGSPAAPGRAAVRPRRRRTGQLALPLEAATSCRRS
ncbi:MAG: hypothetical protein M3019_05710 [Candidatus Dormibacteraeota bacterium]|nr:hypothetical protein [Candidatus Dormibacteraeota bacterium]